MRDLAILFVHLFVVIYRLARPGGIRSVIAESVLVKHQLLILNLLSCSGDNRIGKLAERNTDYDSAKSVCTKHTEAASVSEKSQTGLMNHRESGSALLFDLAFSLAPYSYARYEAPLRRVTAVLPHRVIRQHHQ